MSPESPRPATPSPEQIPPESIEVSSEAIGAGPFLGEKGAGVETAGITFGPFVETAEDELDAWLLDDEQSPEEAARANKDIVAAQLFGMGVNLKEGEEISGITAADIADWYSRLDEDGKKLADETKVANNREKVQEEFIMASLGQSAPELLEGSLPSDLETLIGPNYVLGANQSGAYSPAEAQAYLTEEKGINVTAYNLSHRFLMFDKRDADNAKRVTITGYYGTKGGGKFIVAFPLSEKSVPAYAGESVTAVPDRALVEGNLPQDMVVRTNSVRGAEQDKVAVNAKYCVGFIDANGTFIRNKNFMKSAEALLTEQVTSEQTSDDWL